MDAHKDGQPTPQPQEPAGVTPEKSATPPADAAAAPEPLTKIESPALVPPQAAPAATAPPVAPPVTPPPPIVAAAPVAPAFTARIDAPRVEPVRVAPSVEPPKLEAPPADTAPSSASGPRATLTRAAASVAALPWTKARHYLPHAATIVVAAAIGAMAGSFATAGMGGGAPVMRVAAASPAAATPAAATPAVDTRPLRDSIAHLNSELAALKASVETSSKTANTQFTKLADRFDRFERAQVEPTLKLAKLVDAVDRLEHRAPAATPAATPASATAHDITGAIAGPGPQGPAETARVAGPPVVDGWTVRGVYNGAALIQSRVGGVVEVEPGDNLPGLGLIHSIRRQDGRWVVLTSRGMIVAR